MREPVHPAHQLVEPSPPCRQAIQVPMGCARWTKRNRVPPPSTWPLVKHGATPRQRRGSVCGEIVDDCLCDVGDTMRIVGPLGRGGDTQKCPPRGTVRIWMIAPRETRWLPRRGALCVDGRTNVGTNVGNKSTFTKWPSKLWLNGHGFAKWNRAQCHECLDAK